MMGATHTPRMHMRRLGAVFAVALILASFAQAFSLTRPGAPVAHAATLNAIQLENQKPGTPGWNDFNANSSPTALSGFAAPVSINLGQTVNFYVTTTASSVSIDVFRTGWYSGVGARLMTSLGTFTGQAQAIPAPDHVTGIVECKWQKTASLTVPSTWTSGVYLAKLTSSAGDKSFVTFVVRNDSGHEDFLVETGITTAEAYNTLGGTSLYNNLTNGSVFSGPHATKVSFDRPFNPGDGNGSGQYLWFDYPFVRWAEAQGFDMSYTTNIDMDSSANPVLNHKVFVSLGHDEYWSKGERDNVESAISKGIDAAFFGANISYWQIRFEPDSAGNPYRTIVGYKDYATDPTPPGPDPMYGVNNAIVTTNWRDPVVNRPENSMIGIMYEDQLSTAPAAYIVQNASNWVYANSGFTNGTSIPGIVGYEYDRVFNNGVTPAGLTVLSNSPVSGLNAGASHANSSIYTAPSGAQVFAAGTIEWSWGLDNFGGRTTANKGIQQTTANIMYAFSGETPPPPPPPLPAGVYLQDDFESGNLTKWMGPNGTGSATAESTVVNSGSFAAAITNQSGQYTFLTAQLSAPEASTYTRFYFRVASPASSTATLATGRDANNNTLWSVVYDAGRKGIDAYFWNDARTRYDIYSATNIVAPDTWYGLEVQSNETSTGHGEVWLNGGSVGHVDGDLSTATPYSQLQLWNDATGTVYDDDVIVSDAYNGAVGGQYPTPNAALSPTSLTFASQNVNTTSAAQAVTLTNSGAQTLAISSVTFTGTNPGDFAQTNTCGASVSVGQSCAINVTFSPGANGTRTANLVVADNAPSGTQTVTLTGTGVTPPPAPPPADGIYFQDGFESGSLSAWHTPSGNGAATVENTKVNSGAYAMAMTDATNQMESISADLIGGGEALTYTRFYANIAPGLGTTTLAAGTDDNNNLMWIVVYDAGRQGIDAYFWNGARTRYDIYSATNVLATNTWYGIEVEDNESTTGHAEVWLNGVSLGAAAGVDLSATNYYSHLALQNQATGTVYYDDVIIHNVYNGAVNGVYPTPGAALSPTSLTFSSQNVGSTSAAQTVTLTNNGGATLSISSIGIGGTNPGDFAQTTTCGSSLAASASCAINVTFTPTASGTRTASLTINDNASGGSQSVSLSGTGVTPPPPPPPANGIYFQDGFESGNFSAWNAPAGTGSATVQTTVVHSGTYAADLTNTSGQYESVSANLIGGGEALTYTTFSFNLPNGATTTTLAQGSDANGNAMWVLVYDAGRQGIDAYFWNGTRTRYDLYSVTNLITPNTWYTVEIEFNESTTGHAEIWLNGTSIASADGDLSASAYYAKLYLVNDVAGVTYFDDVKIANVQ